MATNTYVAIESQTTTSTVASVILGSGGTIPQTYTDLVLVISGKSTSSIYNWGMQFNGDTGNNYSRTLLYGTGTATASTRQTNATNINPGFLTTNGSPTIIHIMDYANSTTYKTSITRAGDASDSVSLGVGYWRGSTGSAKQAITSITMYSDGGTFIASGTTFTLYGIANSNIGAPKAFGGVITQDSTYTYHTFGSSGTFAPQQSLTADVLVVAGGGGGGRIVAGGGGAGGLLGFTSQSLTATNYAVTVGAGGAGSTTSGYSSGATGGDSQFGALTLVKGGGAGGAISTAGGTGGSGGGGGGSETGFTAAGGSPTTSQGFAGGTTTGNTIRYIGAGGGGAGAAGGVNTTLKAGDGGVGLSTYSSWGLVTGTGQNVSGTIYYAGGGGGGWSSTPNQPTSIGLGGFGGGGYGGYSYGSVDVAGLAGTPNTGGGGGAAGNDVTGNNVNSYGKNGGSGVVIIRYAN